MRYLNLDNQSGDLFKNTAYPNNSVTSGYDIKGRRLGGRHGGANHRILVVVGTNRCLQIFRPSARSRPFTFTRMV